MKIHGGNWNARCSVTRTGLEKGYLLYCSICMTLRKIKVTVKSWWNPMRTRAAELRCSVDKVQGLLLWNYFTCQWNGGLMTLCICWPPWNLQYQHHSMMYARLKDSDEGSADFRMESEIWQNDLIVIQIERFTEEGGRWGQKPIVSVRLKEERQCTEACIPVLKILLP